MYYRHRGLSVPFSNSISILLNCKCNLILCLRFYSSVSSSCSSVLTPPSSAFSPPSIVPPPFYLPPRSSFLLGPPFYSPFYSPFYLFPSSFLPPPLYLPPASAKSHASGKSKNPYFRILRVGADVFFDADSESRSPHIT